MSALDKILFAEIKLLSKQISTREPFFRQIACLGKAEARKIVYCEIYKLLFPEDKEFNKFLAEKVIPAFKMLGMVSWNRDVLTEMGLKLGQKTEYGTMPKEYYERVKKHLEEMEHATSATE
jgi:hypothetical protein